MLVWPCVEERGLSSLEKGEFEVEGQGKEGRLKRTWKNHVGWC